MKKNKNNSNASKANKRKFQNQQMSKSINLYKGQGANIPVKVVLPLYYVNALGTGKYTFLATTDTRFATFASILANAPSPFSNFLSLYSEMRISGLQVTISAIRNVQPYTNLYLTVDPEASASVTNPNNSIVVGSPSSAIFYYGEVQPRCVSYSFPGVGFGGNIWISTSSVPLGAVFIGNITPTSTATNDIVWEVIFNMRVEFRLLKTN